MRVPPFPGGLQSDSVTRTWDACPRRLSPLAVLSSGLLLALRRLRSASFRCSIRRGGAARLGVGRPMDSRIRSTAAFRLGYFSRQASATFWSGGSSGWRSSLNSRRTSPQPPAIVSSMRSARNASRMTGIASVAFRESNSINSRPFSSGSCVAYRASASVKILTVRSRRSGDRLAILASPPAAADLEYTSGPEEFRYPAIGSIDSARLAPGRPGSPRCSSRHPSPACRSGAPGAARSPPWP